MTPFESALTKTLAFEGGVSNVDQDRGGLTNHGVTQVTYSTWRARNALPDQPVTSMTDAEMQAIYRTDYWMPAGCENLPPALAEVVFDMAVNSGPILAVKALQRSLKIEADGVVGPQTISAAHEAGPYVALAFLKERVKVYRDCIVRDHDQVIFLSGWMNRLLDQAWRLP